METVHSSSVALNGHAVLIKGESGSGKSSLALKLIMLGAKLIADDQTTVFLKKNKVWLQAPVSLPRGLEIRGIGIVNVPSVKKAQLKLIVDLSKFETNRLPKSSDRSIAILGYSFPFYFFQGINDPANSIYALLKFGIAKVQ